MKFRPCIDIHNGKVKQIVGGSLLDQGDQAKENFAAEEGAEFFARLYQKDGLQGGHVILLNPKSSAYYEETKRQALAALAAYPNGLQIGGGITAENAGEFLEAGASHVIVTSYVFQNGKIVWEHLQKLKEKVGRERIVLDLSCRKRGKDYLIVTDRWQKFTDTPLTKELLLKLEEYCVEYLIHGVDVEGHAAGVDDNLARILADYASEQSNERNEVTYAGGIGSLSDLKSFAELTNRKINYTIGSALDLFGGQLPYDLVKKGC